MNKILWALLLILIPSLCLSQKERRFDIALDREDGSAILACQAPELAFHLPEMAGNFRIGFSKGEQSLWSNEVKEVKVEHKRNKLTYVLSDPFFGKGTVIIRIASLSDTKGVVIEIETTDLPAPVEMIWSYGGAYGKEIEDKTRSIMEPAYCKYNVFSVERTSFTVYYGESMNLKIFQGITPLASEIRLSDANRQETPLILLHSGKKTEAPALAASCLLPGNEKLYFCFYLQNKKADYNYYMLQKLFQYEFHEKENTSNNPL